MGGLYRVFDNVYIVSDTRTLFIDGLNILVFSDLHLGFEEDMARQGVFLPRAQLSNALSLIDKAFGIVGCVDMVVINGDLKHCFERLLKQERIEARKLLDSLFGRGVREVVVVRGNHDNYLPFVLRDYGLELRLSYSVEIAGLKILFTHGHLGLDRIGSTGDVIVIGHEHPSIAVVDELGLVVKTPAYLKIPCTNGGYILVLPAMGIYQSGNRVSLDRESYLSPIVREKGVVEEAIPYAVIEDEGILELPRLETLYTSLLEGETVY